MDKRLYLDTKIKPIMDSLVYQLVSERPDNPTAYIIDWLLKTGDYTSNGLSFDEKNELDLLRKEINKFRELEGYKDEEEEAKSEEDSEEEEKLNDLEIKKKQIKGKGPRIGISAECYGQFNKKENFIPRFIKKTDEQINRIKLRILQSFVFSNLDQKDVAIVIGAMEEKIFNSGETVINQGEQGDCLFIVDSGDLDCYKKFTKDGKEELVRKYSAGDSFGELALLYNAPRAAKIVAKTKSILWALDRETFNNIVKEAAQKKREKYENFLRSVSILESIESYELTQICDALKSCQFKEGEYVIREGEVGDVFYIIEEGEATATKTKEPGKAPEPVLHYKKGGYFGELALISGVPRAANIVAKTDLSLISLDRLSFKRLLGSLEDILKRRSEKIYGKVNNRKSQFIIN